MAKRATGPAVLVGVLCASAASGSQVLAGFDFHLWLQLMFTALTTVTAGAVAWVSSGDVFSKNPQKL